MSRVALGVPPSPSPRNRNRVYSALRTLTEILRILLATRSAGHEVCMSCLHLVIRFRISRCTLVHLGSGDRVYPDKLFQDLLKLFRRKLMLGHYLKVGTSARISCMISLALIFRFARGMDEHPPPLAPKEP